MNYRWIGACLIILGCGSFGFFLAANHRYQEKLFHQMLCILQFMESELKYRLTPLPELCHQAGLEVSGELKNLFIDLSRELTWKCSPDVKSCMFSSLKRCNDLPANIRRCLTQLGNSLGRYDLDGQLLGIQSVKNICKDELKTLGKDRDSRLRSYQTLGLCAGAAVVILFI